MDSVIIIGGPTASGKSSLAVKLAKSFLTHEIEPVIINADSMQVYEEIPVITAQPSEEEKNSIEHSLYGFMSVATPCSAGLWAQMATDEIKKQLNQNKLPILVGGTGMYMKTLIDGIVETPETDEKIRQQSHDICEELGPERFHMEVMKRDPATAEKLLPTNTQRLKRAWEVFEQTGIPLSEWQKKQPKRFFEDPKIFDGYFLSPPREDIYEKVNIRFAEMMENGIIEEVKTIMSMSLPEHYPAMRAVGVPQIIKYLNGESSKEQAIEKSQQATRNFVKRQFTWFNNQLPSFKKINTHDEVLRERGLPG